ncbi:MAG: acyl-CoA dehydrogenase family protein [Acidimicrobiia bacterium]
MGVDLSEDQRLFVETSERFLAAEWPSSRVRETASDAAAFPNDLWRTGAELGWTSLLVDPADGGGSLSDSGVRDLSLVAELFGRHVAPGPLVPTHVVAAALSRWGSPELRAEWLPGILAGETVASFVASPDVGRSPCGVTARSSANGVVVLDGTARAVETAGAASFHLVHAASPDGDGDVLVVVPAGTDGVQVAAQESLDLARRFGTVSFHGCEVPSSSALLRGTAASEAALSLCQTAAALQCVESTGAAARVFEFTLEWAFDRYSFGRPLASYQEIKHRFADMRTSLEACAATADAAIAAVGRDDLSTAELVSVAQAYVSDQTCEIVQDCVQIHGGIGVTYEHDIHLYLRRVTTNWAQHGAPVTHLEFLAELLDEQTSVQARH